MFYDETLKKSQNENKSKDNNKNKPTILLASINDRKDIENEISKNQKTFRNESNNSNNVLRNNNNNNGLVGRRGYQSTRNISQTQSQPSTAQSSTSTSTGSLSNRLERLLMYYSNPSDEIDDSDIILQEAADSHRANNFNSRQNSHSTTSTNSIARGISSRESSNDTNATYGSMFGGSVEHSQTLEELEEMMFMEVSILFFYYMNLSIKLFLIRYYYLYYYFLGNETVIS